MVYFTIAPQGQGGSMKDQQEMVPVSLIVDELVMMQVSGDLFGLFEKTTNERVRVEILSRIQYRVGDIHNFEIPGWIEKRILEMLEKRELFCLKLLQWYIEVWAQPLPEIVRAVDFGIKILGDVEKMQHSPTDAKNNNFLDTNPRNQIIKIVVGKIKSGSADLYWELANVQALLLSLFHTSVNLGGKQLYASETWSDIKRAVEIALFAGDTLLKPLIGGVLEQIERGALVPSESLGSFARVDHLHFLRSRLAGLQSFEIKREEYLVGRRWLHAFYEAVSLRARVPLATVRELMGSQEEPNPRAGKPFTVSISLAQDNSVERRKILGALKNFRIFVASWGFKGRSLTGPYAFNQNGEWKLALIPRKGSNKLNIVVKHGTTIFADRWIEFIAN